MDLHGQGPRAEKYFRVTEVGDVVCVVQGIRGAKDTDATFCFRVHAEAERARRIAEKQRLTGEE